MSVKLMTHNIKPFKEVVKAFNDGKKTVLYTSGVGTGKTYVTKAVLETHFPTSTVLYVVPTKAIADYLTVEAGLVETDKFHFATYNAFLDLDKGRSLLLDVDLVILDEAHHIGSDIWGTNLQKLMYMTSCKFLGLTATPKRDDGIDVSKMFDKTVYGISHFEAIKLKIMSKFQYYVCSPKLDDLSKEEKKKIKINYETSIDLLQSLLKTVPRNKWLVFCSSIAQLENNQAVVEALFPEHKVIALHSNVADPTTVLQALRENEKVVLMSCDMLLEGLHIDNVEGILLFRNVQSVVTLQQILGRISKIGMESSPVVIDCTRTAYKVLAKLLKEDIPSFKQMNKSGMSGNAFVSAAHAVLDVPLENIAIYDAMFLLEKVNKRSVIPSNSVDIFKSAKDYIDSCNLNLYTVRATMQKKGITVEEAVKVHLSTKSFIVKGVEYGTPANWARMFNLSPYYCSAKHSKTGLTKVEAAELWMDTSAFFYRNRYYKEVKQVCNHFKINYNKVLKMKKRFNLTYQQTLDYFLIANAGLNEDGKQYTSLDTYCLEFGLNPKTVYALTIEKNISVLEAIDMLKPVSTRAISKGTNIIVAGKKYSSKTEFLAINSLTSSAVYRKMKECNLTYVEAATDLLKEKTKKCEKVKLCICGKYYSNQTEFFFKTKVSQSKLKQLRKANVLLTFEEAAEICIANNYYIKATKLVINGIEYINQKDCMQKLNLTYSTVYKYMKNQNKTFEESIMYLLDKRKEQIERIK